MLWWWSPLRLDCHLSLNTPPNSLRQAAAIACRRASQEGTVCPALHRDQDAVGSSSCTGSSPRQQSALGEGCCPGLSRLQPAAGRLCSTDLEPFSATCFDQGLHRPYFSAGFVARTAWNLIPLLPPAVQSTVSFPLNQKFSQSCTQCRCYCQAGLWHAPAHDDGYDVCVTLMLGGGVVCVCGGGGGGGA